MTKSPPYPTNGGNHLVVIVYRLPIFTVTNNKMKKSKYTQASLDVPMGLTKLLIASLVCTR